MLVGAVMWHIAAGDTNAATPVDVWKDFLKVLEGSPIPKSDNVGSGDWTTGKQAGTGGDF